MNNKKRIILGTFSALALTTLPIALVVSCGKQDEADVKGITADLSSIKKNETKPTAQVVSDASDVLAKSYSKEYKAYDENSGDPQPETMFEEDVDFKIIPPKASGIKETAFHFKQSQSFKEQKAIFEQMGNFMDSIFKWIKN